MDRWRSFWNGGSTGGPIATAWNVQSWPTIYVIDPKGVVRYIDVQGKQLDEAVDQLLQEMENAAAPGRAPAGNGPHGARPP